MNTLTNHPLDASLRRWARLATTLGLAAALLAGTGHAAAHDREALASQASALSALPVAVLSAAPAALLSGGALLTVVAVDASARGTVWLLERASDGVRFSVTVAGGASAAVGGALVVTALASGWLLGTASEVLCFVPNAVGASLLYNERVTR